MTTHHDQDILELAEQLERTHTSPYSLPHMAATALKIQHHRIMRLEEIFETQKTSTLPIDPERITQLWHSDRVRCGADLLAFVRAIEQEHGITGSQQ